MVLNSIYLAKDTTHSPQGKGLVHFCFPWITKVLLSNVWFMFQPLKIICCHWSSLVIGHQIIMEEGLIKLIKSNKTSNSNEGLWIWETFDDTRNKLSLQTRFTTLLDFPLTPYYYVMVYLKIWTLKASVN